MTRFLVVVAMAIIVACGGESDLRRGVTVRDSAGIRIVENMAPSWDEVTAWRLSTDPSLDIGVAEGDPNYELFGVSSVVRLNDGRIAIANASSELRFFDQNGIYLRTVGRRGGGPGEFESISWVRRFRGDSLAVYDSRLNRISIFDGGGAFGRSANMQPRNDVPRPAVVGVFEDGSLLSRGGAYFAIGPIEEGLARDDAIVLRHAPNGGDPVTITTVPGGEFLYTAWRGRVGGGRPLFGREPYFVVVDDRFYVGVNDTYEIKSFTPAGKLESIIRKHHDVRITSEDVDVLEQRRLEQVEDPGMRREVRRAYDDIPTGGLMPAFGWPGWRWGALGRPTQAIQADAARNLWVVDHNRPGIDRNSWTVFDADGELLGSLTLPSGFWPSDIGSDYILGRWRDSLDVTHVQLYNIVKPEG